MRYIRQIWREMLGVPLVGIVTVVGTAISIFLVMVMVMYREVRVAPIAPETNRSRFLYTGKGWHERVGLDYDTYPFEAAYSYSAINELFGNLPHVEALAIFLSGAHPVTVGGPGVNRPQLSALEVNDGFWKVFDFTFLAGRPFTYEEFEGGAYVAVITNDAAHQIFGNEEAVGRTFTMKDAEFKVVGVVADVSLLTESAYSQIWYPITATGNKEQAMIGYTGFLQGIMLADNADCVQEVRAEVARRREAFNTKNATICRLLDSGAPHLVSDKPYGHSIGYYEDGMFKLKIDNGESVLWSTVFGIIILLLAINLSGMTQSRMRRRVTEIGIRRAFGCPRARLVYDILVENFFLTLVGGVLGLAMCFIVMWSCSDFIWKYMNFGNYFMGLTSASYVSLSMLFNWHVFVYALLACMALNIICCGVPVWRATRINPIEAITGIDRK